MTTSGDHLLLSGGPTDTLLRRARLAPDRAVETARGAALVALVTWLPLLLLSFRHGHAAGLEVAVPFLRDFAAHTRLLLAVPVLLFAPLILGPRLARVVGQFLDGGLIASADVPRFDAAVRKVMRRRDSVAAEAFILLLACAMSWGALWAQTSAMFSTWYATGSGTGFALTPAGWWYVAVSLPVFQFLLLRWAWRWFIWTRFLARVARLDLRLVATHPDRVGGLGFVGDGQTSFGVIVFAASVVLSAVLAERVLYGGSHLTDFQAALATFVVLAVAVTLGPLIVFRRPLAALRRDGLFAYTRLAGAHHRAFEARWLAESADEDALLGNPDVSSLADLNAGFESVQHLRRIPADRNNVVSVVLSAALPMIPLVALEVPLRDILKGLLGILV